MPLCNPLTSVVDRVIRTLPVEQQFRLLHHHPGYFMLLMTKLRVCLPPSPRQARFWVEKYIEQIIFELLQDYFAVTVLMEDERALEVYSHAPGNCIMAKFPIGLVVRYWIVNFPTACTLRYTRGIINNVSLHSNIPPGNSAPQFCLCNGPARLLKSRKQLLYIRCKTWFGLEQWHPIWPS